MGLFGGKKPSNRGADGSLHLRRQEGFVGPNGPNGNYQTFGPGNQVTTWGVAKDKNPSYSGGFFTSVIKDSQKTSTTYDANWQAGKQKTKHKK